MGKKFDFWACALHASEYTPHMPMVEQLCNFDFNGGQK